MSENKPNCEYAEGWTNEEGWLVMDNGELICMDWDALCTKCRKNSENDFIIEVKKQ